MTWIHLPNLASSLAMEALHLASASQDCWCKPCATWRLTDTARSSSKHEYAMATLTTPPSGTTYEPSMENRGVRAWIYLLRVFHANLTQRTESILERKIQGIYGPTPYGSFGKWSPNTSSWKMSKDWLLGLTLTRRKSLGIFPKQGIMQDGVCYPLPKSELGTGESVGSVWLPTILANEWKGSSKSRFKGSPDFRGTKMSEGLRICETDPPLLNPLFAEEMMGLPTQWTDLEPLEMDSYRAWSERF